MIVKPYLISSLYATFLVFVESHVSVRRFKKSQALFDRTGYSETQSTRSKIQCAAACEQDDLCQKYSYDNNVCRMGQSANGPGVMYKSYDNCPTDQGYSIWTYDDMQLCLKYYSSGMNHALATSTCGNDGAHLVLIESPAVRMHINETLSGLGVTAIIWLDGYDATGNTDQFINWKGVPLAWIEWADYEPSNHGGDDCMDGEYNNGYKPRDIYCSWTRAVVCQIDIM